MRFSYWNASLATSVASLLVGGCAEVSGLSEYHVEERNLATGATTSGSTSSTGNGGSGGSGGGGGGGGGPPCVPTGELCNGIDDDCDGVADEPDSGAGLACGCEWLTFGGQLYAACETNDAPAADLVCPAGMGLVVLQSLAEADGIKPLLGMGDRALIGLQQDPGGCDAVQGWHWDRTGMPIPWAGNEPSDYSNAYPSGIETGSEQCAGMVWATNSNANWVHDLDCGGSANRYLCEQLVDECVQGQACLIGEGCRGVLDCSLPEAARCVPAPVAESCNGFDDDCNGMADDGNVCGCTVTSFAGSTYKYCTAPQAPRDAHCGPGFCLAKLSTQTEINFVRTFSTVVEYTWFGGFQARNAMFVDEDWVFLDGSPIPDLWAAAQPDDLAVMSLPSPEDHEQDCGAYRPNQAGLRDLECTDAYPYLCEMR